MAAPAEQDRRVIEQHVAAAESALQSIKLPRYRAFRKVI